MPFTLFKACIFLLTYLGDHCTTVYRDFFIPCYRVHSVPFVNVPYVIKPISYQGQLNCLQSFSITNNSLSQKLFNNFSSVCLGQMPRNRIAGSKVLSKNTFVQGRLNLICIQFEFSRMYLMQFPIILRINYCQLSPRVEMPFQQDSFYPMCQFTIIITPGSNITPSLDCYSKDINNKLVS